MRKYAVIAALALAGCAIHDETLSIADDLVTIEFRDSKPKVRVATGSEYCKWRGKVNIEGHYYIGMSCIISIPP